MVGPDITSETGVIRNEKSRAPTSGMGYQYADPDGSETWPKDETLKFTFNNN